MTYAVCTLSCLAYKYEDKVRRKTECYNFLAHDSAVSDMQSVVAVFYEGSNK